MIVFELVILRFPSVDIDNDFIVIHNRFILRPQLSSYIISLIPWIIEVNLIDDTVFLWQQHLCLIFIFLFHRIQITTFNQIDKLNRVTSNGDDNAIQSLMQSVILIDVKIKQL